MLSAKDISDRLLRLELAVSNIADEIVGLNKQHKQLMEDFHAYRKQSTTSTDARDSKWLDTERQGEAEQEGST